MYFFSVGIVWYIIFLSAYILQLVTPLLTVVAILDQYKSTVMEKQNRDSSDVSAGISMRGVNGDAKLVSFSGKGGLSWLPTTHVQKSTMTQPTGITDMKRREKVTFSCMDIWEKQKLSPMTGLLSNDIIFYKSITHT